MLSLCCSQSDGVQWMESKANMLDEVRAVLCDLINHLLHADESARGLDDIREN